MRNILNSYHAQGAGTVVGTGGHEGRGTDKGGKNDRLGKHFFPKEK
jgi:hypothetical protein